MNDWYSYYENGKEVPPKAMGILKALVQQGKITRETMMKDEAGNTMLAGDIDELFPTPLTPPVSEPIHKTVYEMTPPPPRPQQVEPDPFALHVSVEPKPTTPRKPAKPKPLPTPPPTGNNPFEFQPEKRGILNFLVEKITNFFKSLVIFCITVFLLCVAGGVAWEIFTRHQLIETTEKAIQEKMREHPWEKTYMSVTPTNLVHLFADHATVEYSTTIKATEGRYEFVNTEFALKELGIPDNEADFLVAVQKAEELPEPYRSDLYNTIPKGDLSSFQFYHNRVPIGSEKTITGNTDLTRDAIWQPRWQSNVQMKLPEEELIPLSDLPPGANRLDDETTKKAVSKIIQDRDDFIKKVDLASDEWKLNDVLKGEVREKILNAPLEIISLPERPAGTNGSASGKFTVVVKATENFYKSVRKEDVLKEVGTINYEENANKLGIPANMHNTYKAGVEAKVLNRQFYKMLFQNGDNITLSGNIELAKISNGDWQATNQVQFNPISIGNEEVTLSSLVPQSQLPDNNTIIGAATAETIMGDIDRFDTYLTRLKKQKDDFDKFCGAGMKYEGSFTLLVPPLLPQRCRVDIEFTGLDANKATGTITYKPEYEILVENRLDRVGNLSRFNKTLPFTINTNTNTGDVNIAQIGNLAKYREGIHETRANNIYSIAIWNTMTQNTEIRIQVENVKPFSIRGNGANNIPRSIEFDLQAINPPTGAFPWTRDFLVKIIKEYDPGSRLGGTGGGTNGGTNGETGDATNLLKEIQEVGFGSLSDYLRYGTPALQDELRRAETQLKNANPRDEEKFEAAQKELKDVEIKIEDELKKIAKKVFFLNYTCSASNTGGVANHFAISTGAGEIRFTDVSIRPEKVLLPDNLDINCTEANMSGMGRYSFNFTMRRGNNQQDLLDFNTDISAGKYQAKAKFTGLRRTNLGPVAEILDIRIEHRQ